MQNFNNLSDKIKLKYYNASDLEEKNKISDDDHNINLNIILTKKINDFYLGYCKNLDNNYFLFNANGDKLNEIETKTELILNKVLTMSYRPNGVSGVYLNLI